MELNDIKKTQDILRNDIKKALKSGNIYEAINIIDVFAEFTTRVNNILRDDYIEESIKLLSKQLIDAPCLINGGDDKTVVLYDQIGTTKCLCEQYLRGLAANGYNIVYICENRYGISESLLKDVRKICKSYHIFKSNRVFQNGEYLGNTILKVIIDAKPSKIIFHSPASGTLGMTILYSIKGVKKYRIVPGDHHFYIGCECFDYFIEFRPFGWSTAIYERKISPNKIYNISYFPIIDDFFPFSGLPIETKNKIIFAAGGAPYKFQGSDVIPSIVEKILLLSNETVFVYIGLPNKDILDLSKKHKWSDRIFILGYRNDFSAVIRNIDVLINSYPFSGGLICQTAAIYKKPILGFSDIYNQVENSVENLLGCNDNNGIFTYTTIEGVVEEAKSLIIDSKYRKQKGELAFSMLQTNSRFNSQLGSMLKGESCTININDVPKIDRTNRIRWYISIQNDYQPECLAPLLRYYRFKVFWKFYCIVVDIIKHYNFSIQQIMASYIVVRKIMHRTI